MTEFVGGLPLRFVCFRHLGSESKRENKAMISEDGNSPSSSIFGMQATVEGAVIHGSPEQRWTNLPVVSVEEVRPVTDIHVEHTTVVVEGSQSADSGDSDIVLSQFFGQKTNVSDDSGNQKLIEDDPFEFPTMLEGEVSTAGAVQTYVQTVERVTFLSDAAQLMGTAQTSSPLKREMWATENGRVCEMGLCRKVGGPLSFWLLKSESGVIKKVKQCRVELGLLVRCGHILAVLTHKNVLQSLVCLSWKRWRGQRLTKWPQLESRDW